MATRIDIPPVRVPTEEEEELPPTPKLRPEVDPATGFDVRDHPMNETPVPEDADEEYYDHDNDPSTPPIPRRPSPGSEEELAPTRVASPAVSPAPTRRNSVVEEPALITEAQFEKAQQRLQFLARQLNEHYQYLQLLHEHLKPWGLTLPPLPREPSFGPILAGKVKGNHVERQARLDRHLTQLETTLEQHWTYLQKLETYLGAKQNAEQIKKESSKISLFFPRGTIDERLAYMEKLLERLENVQREQRAYLKGTDALFRPKK
jgi:hypothetical protein